MKIALRNVGLIIHTSKVYSAGLHAAGNLDTKMQLQRHSLHDKLCFGIQTLSVLSQILHRSLVSLEKSHKTICLVPKNSV